MNLNSTNMFIIFTLLVFANVIFFALVMVWRAGLIAWNSSVLKQLKIAEDELNTKISNHNANVSNLSADLKRKGNKKEIELFQYALQQNEQVRNMLAFVVEVLHNIPTGGNGAMDSSDKCATLANLQEYIDRLDGYIVRDSKHLSEITK